MAAVDVTFHPSWWNRHGFGFEERFFSDPKYRIATDREMRRVLYEHFGEYGIGDKEPQPRPILDSDLLAGEYLQSQMLGCQVDFSHENLPYVHPLELSDSAAAALSAPSLENCAAWRDCANQLSWLESEYGRAECYLDCHGVQNLAMDLRGTELFMDYYDQPELARHLIAVSLETILSVSKELRHHSDSISVGVTSVIKRLDPNIYVTSNCTCEMISRDIYREFLQGPDRALSEVFQPFGIHHCGQSAEHLIDAYRELKPDFIEIGAGSDIEACCKDGEEKFVNLRFSPVLLLELTAEKIREKVNKMAIEAGSANFSFSCVGIDAATPDENTAAFLESAYAT